MNISLLLLKTSARLDRSWPNFTLLLPDQSHLPPDFNRYLIILTDIKSRTVIPWITNITSQREVSFSEEKYYDWK